MENPWSAYLSDGDPLALSTHCPNTISSTHMQMIKLLHSQHAGRNAKMSDSFPTTWSRTMSVCRGTRKSTCISISSLTALSTQHDRYLQRCAPMWWWHVNLRASLIRATTTKAESNLTYGGCGLHMAATTQPRIIWLLWGRLELRSNSIGQGRRYLGDSGERIKNNGRETSQGERKDEVQIYVAKLSSGSKMIWC